MSLYPVTDMADWDDEAAAAPVAVEEEMAPPTADMPEIHLFGKWSCEDVQVPDISLQVGTLTCMSVFCLLFHLEIYLSRHQCIS